MLLHTSCPCNINAITMTTVTSSEIIHLYNYGTSSEGKKPHMYSLQEACFNLKSILLFIRIQTFLQHLFFLKATVSLFLMRI